MLTHTHTYVAKLLFYESKTLLEEGRNAILSAILSGYIASYSKQVVCFSPIRKYYRDTNTHTATDTTRFPKLHADYSACKNI